MFVSCLVFLSALLGSWLGTQILGKTSTRTHEQNDATQTKLKEGTSKKTNIKQSEAKKPARNNQTDAHK